MCYIISMRKQITKELTMSNQSYRIWICSDDEQAIRLTVKFAGTDKPSWFNELSDARKNCNNKNERIFMYMPHSCEPMGEVL